MLVKISEQQWNDLREGCGGNTIFCDPDFIKTVAAVYRVNPAFYCWQENGNFTLGFAAYLRNRRIVQPNYVFYSGFIYDADKDPVSLANSFNALTGHLKSGFLSASWKTDLTAVMETSVLRPAYVISEKKTYIKQLADLTYKPNVNRRIRVAKRENIAFTVDQDKAAGLDWHCREFGNKYAKSKGFIRDIRTLLLRLEEQQLISYYHAYFNEKLVASQILFKDKPRGTAYLWYLASDPAYHQFGTHSALYDFFFHDLKEKEYTRVDLCGANIPSIAAFKANFMPDLHVYHELGYASPLIKIAQAVKKQIKFLFRKIN